MYGLVDELIAGVLRTLEEQGRKPSTIALYEKRFFRPFRRFLEEQSGGDFTKQLCDEYIASAESRHNAKMIGDKHLSSIKRSVRFLLEFHETGTVLPDRIAERKRIVPSDSALSVIEEALDSTGYTDDYCYKMHCVLRKFFCYIEARAISAQDAGSDVIRGFLGEAQAATPYSMGYVIGGLKILAKCGYLGVDKAYFEHAHLSPKQPPKKIIDPYTEAEVASILASFDIKSPVGKRNKAIVLLAVTTGLRGGDIVSMKLSSIDWAAEKIIILQGKTDRLLVIPMPGVALNALSDYILNGRPQTDSDNVFLGAIAPYKPLKRAAAFDDLMERACAKAGVEKKPWRSFHSLRRSYATWMMQESVPITTVSQMLGHSSMDSSQIYLSFDDAQISTCAMTFDELPLDGGVYS